MLHLGGEDVGVERLEFAGGLLVGGHEFLVADALDVGGAEVERQVVRVLVGGAAREPDAVGVGNDGHAVLVFNRPLVVGHAAADSPLAVELVVGTDGEEPRVVPVVFDDGGAELGAGKVKVLDVERAEVGPLGPAGRTGEAERVGGLPRGGERDRVGRLDADFHVASQIAHAGGIGIKESIGNIAEGRMAVGVVSDVRAVGETEADGLDRLEHHAHVPTPGPAVALDVGVDCMAVFANDPAGAKLGLGVLERDAAADAEFFIDLPGQVRVDVEGEDHGLGAALPAFPALAEFRAHAVGDGEAKAGPEAVVDLVRDEAGGNDLALETAVFALAGVAFVVKIDRNPGARRLHSTSGYLNRIFTVCIGNHTGGSPFHMNIHSDQ